jgi:hypothetical protein
MTLIKVGEDVVDLDEKNLSFDETTLTTYLQKEGGYYNNFGGYLAKAEYLLQYRELDYEVLYADTFKVYKQEGGSDKLAEAKTESDPRVIEAKKKVIEAKYLVRQLAQHLKAWDKNHENAQSLGHYLRKEMDKLSNEIRAAGYRHDMNDSTISYEDEVNKIVGGRVDSES